MKNNLIVICAGKNSLHQQWGDLSSYNFDVAVIVYDNTDYSDEVKQQAKYLFKNSDRKFKNIKKCITYDIYSKYEYIGIIDDDIDVLPKTINDVFVMAKKCNFDLCQPTLDGGYYSHPQTITVPGCDFRISNVVEIMCPFFSKRAFDACVFDFDTSPHGQGYGLEYSWEYNLRSHNGITKFGGFVAFIDKYTMKHMNPVVSRLEVSEPDTKYFRDKYYVDHEWVFNDQVIKGYKIQDE
jgi:hypothetical protein